MKNYSKIQGEPSTTASAGLTLPHGTAPSSPVNGDVWTTTAGIYVRVNGATVGPLAVTLGSNNGTAYASSTTSLSADSTWYDTGASVSLSAGTYLVTSFAQGFIRTAGGAAAGIITRLYNVTDAAAVTDSECLIVHDLLAVRKSASGSICLVVTVGSTKTIRMEAMRLTTTYATTPVVDSNTTGRSGITYARIA